MSNIIWKFVNGNVSIKDIENIENLIGLKLPKDYIECVITNNAGYPDKYSFDIENESGKVLEYLLGISKEDDDNIIDAYSVCKNDLPQGVIPFARDGFGNYICFKYENTDKCYVVFYNHENQQIDFISKNFSDFLNKLY